MRYCSDSGTPRQLRCPAEAQRQRCVYTHISAAYGAAGMVYLCLQMRGAAGTRAQSHGWRPVNAGIDRDPIEVQGRDSIRYSTVCSAATTDLEPRSSGEPGPSTHQSI